MYRHPIRGLVDGHAFPLDVVARSDSIARARSLGRLARLADASAVRPSVPVSAWSYPQILARRQEEINVA